MQLWTKICQIKTACSKYYNCFHIHIVAQCFEKNAKYFILHVMPASFIKTYFCLFINLMRVLLNAYRSNPFLNKTKWSVFSLAIQECWKKAYETLTAS